MSGVRVDHSTLRLRAPASCRSESARLKAVTRDKLLQPVLARLGDRLTARLGSKAEVEVRDMRLMLRLKLSELGSETVMNGVVDDLTDYVLSQGQKPQPRNPTAVFDAPVRIFANPAQKRAVALIAAVERRKDAYGKCAGFKPLWAQVTAQGVSFVTECLAECAALDRLDAVATQLSVQELTEVITLIRDAASKEVRETLRTALAAKLAQTSADNAASQPEANTEQSPLARRGTDEPVPDISSDPEPETHVQDQHKEPDAKRQDFRQPQTDANPDKGNPPEKPETSLPKAGPNATGPQPTAFAGRVDHSEMGNKGEDPAQQSLRREMGAMPLVVQSQWCGLLYLVNIAQRTALPEILWRIGVSEGDALREMLMAIAGTEDAAADCLSPAFPNSPEPVPPQQDWARDELTAELNAQMDPETAARATAIDAALRNGSGWSLATCGASALLALAEQALGQTLDDENRAQVFALPGRIVVDDTEITVFQDMDATNLDIRRAGLDADPGWLPWVSKSLTFVFVENEGAL